MGEEKLKVTDRRMFTAEGELREEFRHLEEGGAAAATATSEPEPAPEPVAAQEPVEESRPEEATAAVQDAADDVADSDIASEGEPSEEETARNFQELIAMLAEPAALYLGDAQLPDGRSMEDPRMARLHIDLLATLQAKTNGNLDQREADMLESVLYQLRVRYLQKHGSR